MTTQRKLPEELLIESEELTNDAHSNHGIGEAVIVRSSTRLIDSNARVEVAVADLLTNLACSLQKQQIKL